MCSKCTISCICMFGDYTFPLDLTFRVAMGNRGTTCGLRDIRRHHVFRLGSLISLRSDGASRGCMSGGPRVKVGALVIARSTV